MSVQQDKFKEIADAIRGKTNSTDKIKPSEFASKVNDVYEAGKAEGTEHFNQLVEGTYSGAIDNDKVTRVKQYCFASCRSITSINLPNVTQVDAYGFLSCEQVTSINLPSVTNLGTLAFRLCLRVTHIDLGAPAQIQASTFQDCSRLVTVIIRTPTLAPLANTNAFANCHHFLGTTHSAYNPTGAKDGYVYVPKALVDSYKTATNWVTYADQIRAIEDYPEITGG